MDAFRQQLRQKGDITLLIRARPNARITQWGEELADGSVKIDLHAAAEDGEANEELLRFLAEEFDVPRGQIELLTGRKGRLKSVRITR